MAELRLCGANIAQLVFETKNSFSSIKLYNFAFLKTYLYLL